MIILSMGISVLLRMPRMQNIWLLQRLLERKMERNEISAIIVPTDADGFTDY